jgi:enoyl-CoA hydratase/carnithine racemase
MCKFEEYQNKYKHVTMERRDDIIQMTLHSEGGPLKWGGPPHEELSYAFYDVAGDHRNRCVIITGTGDAFCAEVDLGGGRGTSVGKTASGEPAPAPHAGVRTTTGITSTTTPSTY